MARPFSPRALQFRRQNAFVGGIVLLVIWFFISLTVAGAAHIGFPRTQIYTALLLVIGLIALAVGIVGEVRARRFNRADWALADSLGGALTELWHTPPPAAYEPHQQLATVPGARLVEIERHFDQQTEGAIAGTMSHKMKMFGTTFSTSYGRAVGDRGFASSSLGGFSGSIKGLSTVDLSISTTTRDNLMGDALFSVFEAPGPAGARDTWRVISMSQPGVRSWINDLVQQTAQQFGGTMTHSGTTVSTWSGNLMAQFQPGDISYVTDRLKAIASRPYENREPVDIIGTPAGRNAVMVTSVRIAGGEELLLMPSAFPGLFGTAIARGVAGAERTLSGGKQPAAIKS